MFSTPTVAGDLLFVGSCAGAFYALDKKTGQVRWSYDIRKDGGQSEFHGDPLITEELVIIGTDGPDIGHIYAFERMTGKVRWKYVAGPGVFVDGRRHRGVVTDILGFGPYIYAVSLGDELICLDSGSGTLIWIFPSGFPVDQFFWNSSPAVAANRVFFGGLNGTVYALEAESGGGIWKQDLGARISTSLIAVGEDLYLGASNGHMYRLSQKTGTVIADFVVEAEPRGRIIPAGDSLLIFLGGKTLTCLDLSLKTVRWSQKSSAGWSSSRPCLWRNTALAGNEQGEVFAFRLTDGSQQWSHKFDGVIRGIGSADEVLYIGTLKGTVYAYAPEQKTNP